MPRVKRTDVAKVSALSQSIKILNENIVGCNACPRLVQWREEVARTKRKAYINEDYWGKPVTGFGSEEPRMIIVGLAPGAHGANRTGRIFTGDSSGDWLYGSLHRIGIARIPTSTSRDDGQELKQTRITMAVHCAPPGNAPTVEERDRCAPWLRRELELSMPTVRAFVALGAFGLTALRKALTELDHPVPKLKFGHGASAKYQHDGVDYLLIASYHPSQQNTFTGKLTQEMLDSVLKKAGRFASVIG
ncbi:MAG: uracil-DNA glycosylase [Candidatus Nanopelagicaceae bacterium]|nr:uracil-DNA glycosylase [Candidatus Nanopelagicaceae bacterium]